MVIIDQEQPHYENKQPTLGGVISSLNKLVYLIKDRDAEFQTDVKEKLANLQKMLDKYNAEVPAIISQHKATVGPAHGETKATVGLSKRDNFRNATQAEVLASSKVNAVVKIEDVKVLFDQHYNVDISNYQANDIFPMGGFNRAKLLPSNNVSDKPDPIHIYNKGQAAIVQTGDRLVISPIPGDENTSDRFSLLYSDPVRLSSVSMEEYPFATDYFNGWGWNMTCGATKANKIVLFRPVPDKGLFAFNTNLGLPPGAAYMMFESFGSQLYRGVAMGVEIQGDSIIATHRVFRVQNPLEASGTLVNAIDANYKAVYDTVNRRTLVAPFADNVVYKLTDFVTLAAGVTIRYDTFNEAPFTPILSWVSRDASYYAAIGVPVIFKSGTKEVKKVLFFTEQRNPGNLLPGSTGTVRMLNGVVKDTIGADLDFRNSNFFMDNDPADVTNPINLPGYIGENGNVVNALSDTLGLTIKYSDSQFTNINNYIEHVVKAKSDRGSAIVRRFSPSRYNALGSIPTRIIPYSSVPGRTVYYVRSINAETGLYFWHEYVWYTDKFAKKKGVTDPTFGELWTISRPDEINHIKNSGAIPHSLSIRMEVNKTGVDVNALCFTPHNNYVGYQSFEMTTNGPIVGSEARLTNRLHLALSGVMEDLMVVAHTHPGEFWKKVEGKPTYSVHCTSGNDAVATFSDGIGMFWAYTFKYVLANGEVEMVNKDIAVSRIVMYGTYDGIVPGSRKSISGDDIGYLSSDMLVCDDIATGNVPFRAHVFNSPWYDLRGTAYCELVPEGKTSTRAPSIKLQLPIFYRGEYCIDVLPDEHASTIIPGMGIVVGTRRDSSELTVLNNPSTNKTTVPYAAPDAEYFLIPTGMKLTLGGRNTILRHDIYQPISSNKSLSQYLYIVRKGDGYGTILSSVVREPNNNEVLVVSREGGKYTYQEEYIVIDNHLLSFDRRGTAIPVTWDDGSVYGTNKFFRKTDILPG